MSITTTCPGCRTSYQLADAMRGKKVRCKSCSEVFVVRDKTTSLNREEDEERIQSSPRPAKPGIRDEEDEDMERPLPRRWPRKKDRNSTALPLIIAGCIAAGVLALVLGSGLTIWALNRLRQVQSAPAAVNFNQPAPVNQPVQNVAPPQVQAGAPLPPADPNLGNANPPPPLPPLNPPPQPRAPADGPLAVELTNGKVSGFGAQMEVTVDYRFTSGNPAGRRLFLIIKATKAGGLRQNYYLAELKTIGGRTEGTIGGRGMSFGIEHGPFEMWLGEGPVGIGLPTSDKEIKKISNVVTVATKQFAPPGMRPPIGPRRIRP